MGRVWLVLAMLLLIAWRSEAHAQCRPTAIASGEPALVLRLTERLTASGIATTSTRGCPSARVRVEQRGEQILVEVTDGFGRTGTRQVRDVATAAAIVESWTSQEVEPGSLPALAPIAVAGPTASGPTLAASFESAAGSNGSIWMGGAMSGCVRVSAACVGGLVRAARDTREASTPIVHDSAQIDALVTIGLPRRLGGFTIMPGVGVGYGYHQLTEYHRDVNMHLVSVDRPRHGLLADAHVSITRGIAKRLALYADLRGDAAVIRSTETGPRGFARASIGLRLGSN